MAQTGYTPIQLYYSTTASAVPTNTNLANGELAINITDGKLYYKDNTGTVKLLTSTGSEISPITNNGVVYLNGSGQATSGSALTFDGSTLVSSSGIRANSFMEIRSNTGALYWENAANTLYWAQSLDSSDFKWTYYNGSGVSEQMRLTSTGLGIGTSSPAYKLDVVGAGSQSIRVASSNGDLANLLMLSNGNATWSLSSDTVMRFKKDSTEYMRIDSSGNVGIGTSSPTGKLHVSGTGYSIFTGSANSQTPNTTGLSIGYNRSGANGETSLVWGAPASGFNFEICSFVSSTITPRLTIDTSGNLGLGVTPSAWYTSYGTKVFQFAASGVLYGLDVANSDRRVILQNNAYVNAYGNEIYLNTGAATKFLQSAGAHSWHTAGSGNAGDAISFTQAMTLDASGDLLLGTTTKVPYSGNPGSTNLTLSGTSNPSTARPSITLKNSDDSARAWWVVDANNGAFIGTQSNNYFGFQTNNTERARINSSGAWSFGSSGTNTGNAGEVLTSQGSGSAPTWAAAGGGGAWTYISTTTATNAASLAITSGVTSTYAMYMFYIEYMYGSNSNADIFMKWYEGGSLSSNNYNMRTIGTRAYNTTAYDGALTGSSQFYLNRGDAIFSPSSLAGSLRGTITLFNPSSTNQGLKMMEWDIMLPIYDDDTGSAGQSGNVKGFGSGASSGTAVTGIQLSFSAGNIYARVHMYGLKTS